MQMHTRAHTYAGLNILPLPFCLHLAPSTRLHTHLLDRPAIVRAQGRNRDLMSLTAKMINEARSISKRLPARAKPEKVNPFSHSTGSCSDHNDGDCVKCLADPACGYCSDQKLCLEGTVEGPVFGQCTETSPDAHASTDNNLNPNPEPKPNWLHVGRGSTAAPLSVNETNDPFKQARLVCRGGEEDKEEDVPHFIAPIDERLEFEKPMDEVAKQLHVTWTADLHGLECQRRLLEWISRRDDEGKPWTYAETEDTNALMAEWFNIRYEDGDELPVECRDASIISEVVRKHAAATQQLDDAHTRLRRSADWLVIRVPADTFIELETTRVGKTKSGADSGEIQYEDGSDIMKHTSPFHSRVRHGERFDNALEVGTVVTFNIPAQYLLGQLNLQQSILLLQLQHSVGNRPKEWVLPR